MLKLAIHTVTTGLLRVIVTLFRKVLLELTSVCPWKNAKQINFRISNAVIFWGVMVMLVGKYVLCFGGTCRLLLQGITVDTYRTNYMTPHATRP
jgi:hypothetical protein